MIDSYNATFGMNAFVLIFSAYVCLLCGRQGGESSGLGNLDFKNIKLIAEDGQKCAPIETPI